MGKCSTHCMEKQSHGFHVDKYQHQIVDLECVISVIVGQRHTCLDIK